uniref:U2 small nuclear ribonucleoprotein A n=1 Tax=Parascaris equorum TaxID=6256 RepID=A0A914RTN7_PAREQ
MVRLTVDLINDSLQYINTVRERELSLRACKIPVLENLGVTRVLPSLRTLALTNNNLCELGDIDPLATCKKLEYLTLIGNPVPSVRVLDFKRVRLSVRFNLYLTFDSFFEKKGRRAMKIQGMNALKLRKRCVERMPEKYRYNELLVIGEKLHINI